MKNAKGITDSREFRRLEEKTGIELLWLYVLSLLKRKGQHAYALRKDVEDEFSFKVGNVTTYVVLYKLESRGFVESKTKKNRVVYRITKKGKVLFKEAEKYLKKRYKKLFA